MNAARDFNKRALAAAIGLLLVAVPTAGSFAAEGIATLRGSTCERPAPTSAAELSRTFASMEASDFVAGDGTISTRLPDGRSVFLMGDTFIDYSHGKMEPFLGPGTEMVRNSALILDRGCMTRATTPGGNELFKSSIQQELFYWPTAAVAVSNKKLWAVTESIHATSVESLDFQHTGAQFVPVSIKGDQLKTGDQIAIEETRGIRWGAGLGVDGDTAVIYGTLVDNTSGRREVYVARADLDTLTQQHTWEYLGSEGWSKDVEHATAVMSDASTVVSPVPGNPWSFVTKRGDAIGSEIILTELDGNSTIPVSQQVMAHEPSSAERWAYNPQIHLIGENGRERPMLTINHNSTTGQHRDRSTYLPRAIALEGALNASLRRA